MARHRQSRPELPRATLSWLRIAAIVLTGMAIYANSTSAPFILDDEETVVINQHIRRLWPPSEVLSVVREVPVAGRPVVNVSFALNYAWGGLDVRSYHLGNIATHIASALLTFGIVSRTLRLRRMPPRFSNRAADLAFACALVWMVHPLQTESVNYITQRTELLMGFFYLLTLYASIRGQQAPGWRTLAIFSCLLGMGCKESMATAPVIVVLYDRIFVFESLREAMRVRWRLYAALAATWIPLAVLIWPGPRSLSTGFSTGVDPWTYLLNQAVMIVRYLRLTVWPRGLVIDYGVPRALMLVDVMPYVAVVLALAALAMMALVYRPKMGFLGAWFFVTLAPTSSVVPISTWVGAERRMYLPLAGLVVLAVVSVTMLWAHLEEKGITSRLGRIPPHRALVVGRTVLAVLCMVLATGTVLRNKEYASSILLAQTVIERWPHGRAHHWLGIGLLAAGKRDEGVLEFREAIRSGEPRAHFTLGLTLFQEGKPEQAIAELREFIRAEPLRIEVIAAHEMIGRAFLTQGKFAGAAEEFRLILKMTPDHVNARGLLGEALMKQRQFSDAARYYQEFLKAHPANFGIWMNLGIAFASTGQLDAAIDAFRHAVAVSPQDGSAWLNLAQALLENGQFDEAAEDARQAVRLRPDDPLVYANLGVALASQRKFDDAIAVFQRSLALDPNDSEVRAHLNAALDARDAATRTR